jgi:HK97 family phage major capsid protein
MKIETFKTEQAAFRAGMWLRSTMFNSEGATHWCAKNGLPIRKVGGENPNTAGGFLVPTEMSRAIIAHRDVSATFRNNASVVPMGSDAQDWPRRTGGVSAFWQDEAVAITESQVSLDSVGLVASKLAALVRTSSELEDDSAPDLAEYLAQEMGFAFATKEDDCGWNGDGTSTYRGIMGITKLLIDGSHNAGKVSAVAGHDTYAELDSVDLTNLVGAVPAYALPGAKWYASNYAFATSICRLSGTNGGIQSFNGKPYFMGFQVEIVPQLPQVATTLAATVMIVFGDLELSSTVGNRKQLTMARSAERLLDTDQILFKGTERVSIVNHSLGDNTTAGPVVGLVGTA